VRGAKGRILGLGLAAVGLTCLAAPAQAYLYWNKPSIAGAPVTGTEPGIMLPMPGAQPKELAAGLLWTMRAGLNVAALQCQFAPGLATVRNYNNMLKQHSAELQAAYATLGYLFGRDLPALEHHLTEATIVGVVLVVLWLVYTRLRGGRTAEAR